MHINTELLDGNQGHQEETHRPTHRFRRLFLDLLSMGWRGCASAMGAIKLPPSCSSPKIMCQSIYIIKQYTSCKKNRFIFIPRPVLSIASDYLNTVKYRHIFHIRCHQGKVQWGRNVSDGVTMAIATACYFPRRWNTTEHHCVYTMI